MGTALPHALVLFHRRREDVRPHPAGDGQTQRPLDRWRHQFHRLEHTVWPPLGLDRTPPVPAFRDLLLPGDRLCDRAQASPRRGRRRRPAQDFARLYAGDNPVGALHRRSGAAPRHCRLPHARARPCRGGSRLAFRGGPRPQRLIFMTSHAHAVPRAGNVVVALIVSFAVWGIMAFRTVAYLRRVAGGLAPFDLRPFGYTVDEARALLHALSDIGRRYYADVQLQLDTASPALYALSRI